MATASRNERKKRRLRRNVTLLRRAVTHESLSRAKTTVALFALLNSQGGEIEVKKSDFDAAVKNLTNLAFVIEPSAVEGNFMVKLVTLTEQSLALGAQPTEETLVNVITPTVVPADPSIAESTETIQEQE